MNIYKEYQNEKKSIKIHESWDDVFVKYEKVINIDMMKYLYRMTDEYILFRGRKKYRDSVVDFDVGNKWDKSDIKNLVRIESINCLVFRIFEQFECVLNEYASNRFLATKDSKLYEMEQWWDNEEFDYVADESSSDDDSTEESSEE